MAKRLTRPLRLATFTLSTEADLDLSAVYTNTAQTWGIDQAERYALFLNSYILDLACAQTQGRPIAERPGLRSLVARWKNAKYRHRIVYEETPNGIHVLRILHTAMNLPDHL